MGTNRLLYVHVKALTIALQNDDPKWELSAGLFERFRWHAGGAIRPRFVAENGTKKSQFQMRISASNR
jgi:hypothetical protein